MASERNPLISSATKRSEIQPYEEDTLKSSQANTSHMVQTEVVNSKIKELLDKIEEVNINISSCGTQEIKIQKVPEIMLRNKFFEEYFKPRELSIGPIHAADPKLFKLELKLKLARNFAKRMERLAEDLFKVIENKIDEIKMHFDQTVIGHYAKEELSWLLFLDGCAMLEFIHNFMNQSLNVFDISNGQAALIQQDLFLLENQIPLLVLAELTDDTIYKWPKSSELQNDFVRFIFTSNTSSFPRDWKDYKGPYHIPKRKPVHVLDLLRYVFIIDEMPMLRLQRLFSCGSLLKCYRKRDNLNAQSVPKDWSKKQSFRNVQELKTAGIKFKTAPSLKEVSFHSRFFIAGQLNLPTFIVDKSTPYMLFNLVAYEMCLPIDQSNENDPKNAINNCWVTSYVSLLDLLIDDDQDVKDLRAADIIRNRVSSDIEAANMINGIGSYCIAPPKDTYAHVKYGIEKHYRRKCAIWTAEFFQAHCSSPLTIFALLAGTALLALTIVQTYYAANPK